MFTNSIDKKKLHSGGMKMNKYEELKTIFKIQSNNYEIISINQFEMVTEILKISNFIRNNQKVMRNDGEDLIFTLKSNLWSSSKDKKLRISIQDIFQKFNKSNTLEEFIQSIRYYF
jgi:hypothetical protein